MMVYFIIEFFITLFMFKPPRYLFWFKFTTYIDIAVIAPRLIRLIFSIEYTKTLGFLRILRIFKVFRIVRLIKHIKKLSANSNPYELSYKKSLISPLTRQILILAISLFSTLFIGAGVIIFIDDEFDMPFSIDLNYIDAIYYMAVTGSTLGYGDIVPIIPISRLVVITIIVIIIYIFGTQITKILKMMQGWDSYDTKMKLNQHDVIFLFDDNLEILRSFLLYYFRNEKQRELNGFCKKKRRILIISNRESGIDNRIKGFLQMNIFELRIKYLPSKGQVDRRLIDRACLLDAR